MKQTHQIAYNYCQAMLTQRVAEERVSKAFEALGMDNQVFSLSEPIEGAYTHLVRTLLGRELFEWLMWWMWECEHGTKSMEFIIDGTTYDPTQMTLYRFLEIVDASN